MTEDELIALEGRIATAVADEELEQLAFEEMPKLIAEVRKLQERDRQNLEIKLMMVEKLKAKSQA